MFTNFPATEPYDSGLLDVGDDHHLHYEQHGNPNGITVAVIHGGPGAGIIRDQLRIFDPAVYRIITFDQRGCGLSTPKGEMANNTTDHTIDDMEKLRKHLGVDHWVVMGPSWGSTVALLYAQKYRDYVDALFIRGIFLGGWQDMETFLAPHGTAAQNHTDDGEWSRFMAVIPESERGDMESILKAYRKRIYSDDLDTQLPALHAWNRWEIVCSFSDPVPTEVLAKYESQIEVEMARIEIDYMLNHFFIEPGRILKDLDKLDGIPTIAVIQGTLDTVCDPAQAEALCNGLRSLRRTKTTSILVPKGHAGSVPEMLDELGHMAEAIARRISARRTHLENTADTFVRLLRQHRFAPILGEALQQDSHYIVDLTAQSQDFTVEEVTSTPAFEAKAQELLTANNARLLLGRYDEERTLYQYDHFTDQREPRTVHMGVDLGVPAETAVFAPLDGEVYGFQDNDQPGDYGPTIVLKHTLEGMTFFTLYGHLSKESLDGLTIGQQIIQGERFASIGSTDENGGFFPHVHFQIIRDMGSHTGDYPGVCKLSQRQEFRMNCPDPNLILSIPELTPGASQQQTTLPDDDMSLLSYCLPWCNWGKSRADQPQGANSRRVIPASDTRTPT